MVNPVRDNNYLSLHNTVALRGILALAVFICHLPSYLGLFANTLFGRMIVCLGSPAVGIFFFLSGYGLCQSFSKNGTTYIKTFWKHRILPFAFNYLLVLCVYILVHLLANENISAGG